SGVSAGSRDVCSADRGWAGERGKGWAPSHSLGPKSVLGVWLPSVPPPLAGCAAPESRPAVLACGGDDPPEPPAVLSRGGDPPEPPAVLSRRGGPAEGPCEVSADTAELALPGCGGR